MLTWLEFQVNFIAKAFYITKPKPKLFHLLPAENPCYCESRLAPKLQRITTKLITVSDTNKVFQSRRKDFQDCIMLSDLCWLLHILLLLVYTKSSQVIDDQKVVFCFVVFYYLPMHLLHISWIYWECNLNILLLPPITSYVYTFCNHEQKQFLSYFPSDLQANNFNP